MIGEKDVLAGHAVLDPVRGCFLELIGDDKVHLGSRVNAERTAALTAGALGVVEVCVPPVYAGKRALPPKRDDGSR